MVVVKRIWNFLPFSISSMLYVSFSTRLKCPGVRIRGLSNSALTSMILVRDWPSFPYNRTRGGDKRMGTLTKPFRLNLITLVVGSFV